MDRPARLATLLPCAHLVVAATARVLFAAFLLRVEHTGFSGGFEAFAADPLHEIAERLGWALGAHDAHRRFLSMLNFGLWKSGHAMAERAIKLGEIRKVNRLEITIETNPSSNLTVGDLGDLAHHPLFQMMPLHPGATETPLLASLNTDDPLTFATSLTDEFAHLRFGLDRQGVDGPTALDFLDRLRVQALRSRFTLAASRDGVLSDGAWQRGRR
jgi:hypothetical protein